MVNWQSEYLREKEEKDRLYIVCGELTKQLHEQAKKLMDSYLAIEKLKKQAQSGQLELIEFMGV